MPPQVLILHNPVSGIMDPRWVRRKIEEHFTRHGWSYTFHETRPEEDPSTVVYAHLQQGGTLVIACGGDGTVGAAAGALVDTGIPLGVVPNGTWNALARNLGIPLGVNAALNLITGKHATRALDAMLTRGRCSLLNISAGITSGMILHTDRQSKRRFGALAYFWNMLLSLFGLRLRMFTLNIDNHSRRLRASEVMLVNSSIFGIGELPTSLDIHPDDGIIHVCVLRTRTLIGVLRAVFGILLGRKHAPMNEVRCFKARERITIQTRKPLPVQADGDVIGRTPLRVQVKPNSVQIIVPEKH